jgi:HicA toxin of bacterial toxin-antitoxin,
LSGIIHSPLTIEGFFDRSALSQVVASLDRPWARHREYKHASKPGRVAVAGKPSDDLAPGTLNSILKQAGLKGQH